MKKKGGSLASNSVVKMVSPKTFETLNAMFDNKVSLSGGCGCGMYGGGKPSKSKSSKTSRGADLVKKGGACKDALPSSFAHVPSNGVPASMPGSLPKSPYTPPAQSLLNKVIPSSAPMTKTTYFPVTPEYKGPFSFGGKPKSVSKECKPNPKSSKKAKCIPKKQKK